MLTWVPSAASIRSYLADHGFLEMGAPDFDRIKFARAGRFVYVPRDGAPNFDGSLRMAVLQIHLAQNFPIWLEPPEELRA
jgi:hypothetical protein